MAAEWNELLGDMLRKKCKRKSKGVGGGGFKRCSDQNALCLKKTDAFRSLWSF